MELAAAVFSPVTAHQPMRGYLQVLLGTDKGQLHSFDARSGGVRWREQLGSSAESCGPSTAGISTGAAPAVSSERAWMTFEAGGEALAEEPWNDVPYAGPDRAMGRESSGRCDQQPPVGVEQPSGKLPGHSASQVWSCTNYGDLVLTRHEVDTPAVMVEAHIGSPIFSSPVAFDNIVVFGCRDNHLYCVRI